MLPDRSAVNTKICLDREVVKSGFAASVALSHIRRFERIPSHDCHPDAPVLKSSNHRVRDASGADYESGTASEIKLRQRLNESGVVRVQSPPARPVPDQGIEGITGI